MTDILTKPFTKSFWNNILIPYFVKNCCVISVTCRIRYLSLLLSLSLSLPLSLTIYNGYRPKKMGSINRVQIPDEAVSDRGNAHWKSINSSFLAPVKKFEQTIIGNFIYIYIYIYWERERGGRDRESRGGSRRERERERARNVQNSKILIYS